MRAVRFIATALIGLGASFAILDSGAEAASGRAALLIANAAYPDSDAVLPTPIADAKVLGDELKRRGFDVEIGENLTREQMQAAIERLVRRSEPGSTAMVFFAGYGIQAGRKNHLIPVDARIWSESDVLRDGIGIDTVLSDLEKRGVNDRVVVLDASRRNPFERRFRSFSTGLAAPKAALGTLTLYSAASGSVLNETTANRSLFVTELVKQIGLPDQTAEQAFSATRDAIAKATKNQQAPTVVSNLDEVFSFDPSKPKQAAAKKPPVVAQEPKAAPPPVAEAPKAPVVETKPVVVETIAPPPPPPPPVASEQKPAPAPEPPAPPKVAETPPPLVTETETLKPKVEEPPAPVADAKPLVPEPQAPLPPSEKTETKLAHNAAPTPTPSPAIAPVLKDIEAPLSAEEQAVRAFEAADVLGTRAAYDDFLNRHPTGSLAARARAEIARIDAAEQAAVAAKQQPKPFSQAELARKATLDQRIGKNARDATAYYERGQFYAQRGDAPRAIADFDKALALDPGNAEALNNRCWMRAVANELRLALADCNQALKLRKQYVDALDSRGFVNLKLGDFRAAVNDYDAALRLEASHGSALYGRGVARRKLGQAAAAERDLASALQLNPSLDKEFAQYGLQ